MQIATHLSENRDGMSQVIAMEELKARRATEKAQNLLSRKFGVELSGEEKNMIEQKMKNMLEETRGMTKEEKVRFLIEQAEEAKIRASSMAVQNKTQDLVKKNVNLSNNSKKSIKEAFLTNAQVYSLIVGGAVLSAITYLALQDAEAAKKAALELVKVFAGVVLKS